MKNTVLLTILFISIIGCKQESKKTATDIVSSDIENFWKAYDKVTSTKDTLEQGEFLKEYFIDKGTPGLKAMIDVRRYSIKEYLYAINHFPKFWSSIRQKTLETEKYNKELQTAIGKLEEIYPKLKPAKIYFTIGALRSGGTTMDSLVLVGSELAFTNKDTPTEEFPKNLSHLRAYFDNEPINNIVFLNIHEYIHTQQKTTIGETLLAQTLIEGVAEFVASNVLQVESPNPQIKFGDENDKEIKAAFSKEMFSPYLYNWIWNSPDNKFGIRDLAYYVGYKICSEHYKLATNKSEAIRQMVELDYNNEEELIKFVEASNYFNEPLMNYKNYFESSRPTIVNIKPFKNRDKKVSLKTEEITISFSQEMDTRFRNFEIGPLGENNLIHFKRFFGFSKNGKSLRFEIETLKENKTYQIIVGSGFKNSNGIPLKPYLIEFKTTRK
ncbi:MAG: hypothetical protein V3U92_19315 [Cellulophaga sp.]